MNSFREISRKMDSVETPMSLRALIDMHRWAPSDNVGFRSVVQRHTGTTRESRFLCMNTYLMDVDIIPGAKKPAVGVRAVELGEVIKRNHDVALLQEIFEDNVKGKVLQAWPERSQPFVVEDAKTFSKDSSGLVTISQQDKLEGRVFHEFDNREGKDVWAEKGVLRTTISYGIGDSRLELYNTHLNAAGHAARRLQLLELMTFIDRNHDKKNVAIVAGDFNLSSKNTDIAFKKPALVISGGGGINPGDILNFLGGELIHPADVVDDYGNIDSKFSRLIHQLISDSQTTNGNYSDGMTEYQALVELMDFMGFTDMWLERNGTIGLTENVHHKNIRDKICLPDKDNPELCDDVNVSDDRKSQRLDYMFISQPDDDHSFSLDFTRPRRVRYERDPDAPLREDMFIRDPATGRITFTLKGVDMLSDHIGLSTTLLINPART